jgi:hypothetical protein
MARAEISQDGSALTVRIPLSFRKRGGRKLVIAPQGQDTWALPRPRIDNTMVKAIARAFRWRNRHAHDRRGDSRRREDQCVLRGSRPAADPAIAGDRRGDSGWAAAGGPTARGLAEAVSGRVEGAASREQRSGALIPDKISGLGCAIFRNSFGKSHAGGQARLLASDVVFAESIHCPAGSRPISNVCSIARGHKASEPCRSSLRKLVRLFYAPISALRRRPATTTPPISRPGSKS